MKHLPALLFFYTLAILAGVPAPAQTFSAGTYNIRQLNAEDTARGDGWERRFPVIASLIRFHDFEIFGAQEAFHRQVKDLSAALPEYEYTGVGRDDGHQAGEYCVIFYKRDRFELLDEGHFWLAEDPSRPGRGWDAKYPRICCWGKFRDRASNRRFWFFTLHTDHKGLTAQKESCRLVLAKIRELCGADPVIVTGDFNVGQESDSYAILHDSGLLKDSYECAGIRYAQTGTENWFNPDIQTFRRIDYVFVSPGMRVLRYGILTDTYRSRETVNGNTLDRARTPSDHFPVLVQLQFPN